MNREAALLGTPTWTTFAGELGAVDRMLIEHGQHGRPGAAGAAGARANATRRCPPTRRSRTRSPARSWRDSRAHHGARAPTRGRRVRGVRGASASCRPAPASSTRGRSASPGRSSPGATRSPSTPAGGRACRARRRSTATASCASRSTAPMRARSARRTSATPAGGGRGAAQTTRPGAHPGARLGARPRRLLDLAPMERPGRRSSTGSATSRSGPSPGVAGSRRPTGSSRTTSGTACGRARCRCSSGSGGATVARTLYDPRDVFLRVPHLRRDARLAAGDPDPRRAALGARGGRRHPGQRAVRRDDAARPGPDRRAHRAQLPRPLGPARAPARPHPGSAWASTATPASCSTRAACWSTGASSRRWTPSSTCPVRCWCSWASATRRRASGQMARQARCTRARSTSSTRCRPPSCWRGPRRRT